MEILDNNLKDKSSWGGKRPSAGRPKGSKNPDTLEKEKVLAAVKQRIMYSADSLFNAAKSAAIGSQYLFKIETGKDKKGNEYRKKPQIVTSPFEISEVLDEMDDMGEYKDDDNNTYYFISTKDPDIRAFNALIDRAFGKNKDTVEMTHILPEPLLKLNEVHTNNSNQEDCGNDQENKSLTGGNSSVKDNLGSDLLDSKSTD